MNFQWTPDLIDVFVMFQVSNLKKILKAILDFYAQVSYHSLYFINALFILMII